MTRDIDLAPMLFHPWSYAALLHDVLGINNNKVVLQNEITKNASKCHFYFAFLIIYSVAEEVYDLDPKADPFWGEKMNTPLPIIAEEIDVEMNRWKEEYESMGHKKKVDDVNTAIIPTIQTMICF